MASNIIKQVCVKATFPNGRVVSGVTNALTGRTDEPFQVWFEKGKHDSVIINPRFAETIEINVEYES